MCRMQSLLSQCSGSQVERGNVHNSASIFYSLTKGFPHCLVSSLQKAQWLLYRIFLTLTACFTRGLPLEIFALCRANSVASPCGISYIHVPPLDPSPAPLWCLVSTQPDTPVLHRVRQNQPRSEVLENCEIYTNVSTLYFITKKYQTLCLLAFGYDILGAWPLFSEVCSFTFYLPCIERSKDACGSGQDHL